MPIAIDGLQVMFGGVPVRVQPGPLLAGPSIHQSPSGVFTTMFLPSERGDARGWSSIHQASYIAPTGALAIV